MIHGCQRQINLRKKIMPVMSFFRLFSIFLLYMTLSHALVANPFSVNEDSELSGDLSSSNLNALNFVVNIPPYEDVDSTKSPRYQNFSLQSNGSFTLEAEANWNGTLFFEWNATNSTSGAIINGTATINVNPINDLPQLYVYDKYLGSVTSSVSVEENEQLIGYINVADVDGDSVVLTLSSAVDSQKFIIDTANPAYFNSDGKTYFPLKGNSGFNYEVPSSDAGSNTYLIGVDANDSQGGIASQALNVLVTDQNEAPVLSGPASSTKTIQEDAISETDTNSWFKIHNDSYPGYIASDPDSASTSHTWSFNPAPQMGTAQFSTNANMQTPVSTVPVAKGDTVYLNYIPDANASGTDSFTVQVTDESGNFDEMDFTVEISGVDDLPVFTSEVSSSDNPIIIPSGSDDSFLTLGAQDDDNSSATFTYSIVEDPSDDSSYFTVSSGGQVSPDSATGIISANPDSDDGLYGFQVKATENNGEVVYQSVYVEINEPPYFKDKYGNKVVDPIEVIISEDESPISWDSKWSAEVAGLSAYDPGVSGGPDSLMSINSWSIGPTSSNGMVELKSDGSIDYEPDADFSGLDTFTISATDDSELSASIQFYVTIQQVNDFPVVVRVGNVPDPNLAVVDEGDRFVVDFNGDDSIDPVPSTSHFWELNGTDKDSFYIERNGSLYFREAPDFESKNQYNVEIMVSDDGINFSSPHPLTVNISNVNEPPVFTDNGQSLITDPFLETELGKFVRVDISENYKGVVYDPNCTDPDNDDDLFFTLRLLSDLNVSSADPSLNISNLFSVNERTGQITISQAIDYETAVDYDTNSTDFVDSAASLTGTEWWASSTNSQISNGFHLELNATDNGTSPLITSHKILVVVTDVNEPPVFQASVPVSVTEGEQLNVSVIADDPEGDLVSYGIEEGFDSQYFDMNQIGILSFAGSPPNFESPQDIGKNNTYEVRVYAQSSGSGKVTSDLTVTVLDANDPPKLDREGSSVVEISENSSHVLTFNATDEDHDSSKPDLVYVVDGKEVRYHNHTEQDDDPYGSLQNGTSLHDPYPNDSGAKLVKVADFNRDGLDDILELNSTNLIRVFLNSGNMQFDGPVIVPNSSVSISQVLVDDLSGDGYPDVVALDPDTGKIFAWSWDNSDPSSPLFLPLIEGGVSNELFTGGAQLKAIKLSDINSDGLIDVVALADGQSRILWIENKGGSEFESALEILPHSDYDLPIHDFDIGDLDGDGDEDIILATDANVFFIENSGSDQFESMVSLYNDSNGNPFRLKIGDLNGDSRNDIIVSVERASKGYIDQNIVLINQANIPLAYANPVYFSSQNLILHFETGDLDNDQDLDLITISYTGALELFENSGNGTFTLLDSIDTTKGPLVSPQLANFDNRLDDMQFSITGGKDQSLFEFRPNMSPSLWFMTPPDYENLDAVTKIGFDSNEYEVVVRGDSIDASGNRESVSHTLIVRVQNENDNPPVIQTALTFTLDENIKSIVTLTAIDEDGDSLEWNIIGGRDDHLFSLLENGQLSFKQAPDYEAMSSGGGDNDYLVNVRISDGLHYADQNLTIRLNNLNDTAPVVHNPELQGNTPIAIEENQEFVLELNVTDADQNVGVLIKTIIDGKDSEYFDIVGNDLRFVPSLSYPFVDFENPKDADLDNIYTFDLNISDGVHVQAIPVHVEVLNENDQAPVWITNGGNYDVNENQQFVIDLNASDDFQDSIIFSIDPASPDFQFFDLNQSSGELTFKSGLIPDYESPSDLSPSANGVADGSYEITINLSDPDFNSASQSFVFSVKDIDELPTFTNSRLTLDEDTILSFSSVDFNITDPEGDIFQLSVAYQAEHGKVVSQGGDLFSYSPNADYFGNDTFTLRIDEGGKILDLDIQLFVNNVNDPPHLIDDQFDYTSSNRAALPLPVLNNDSSFPDAEDSEILRIVDWEVDMTSDSGRLTDYDWALSLPPISAGPFLRSSNQFTFTPPAGFIGPVSFNYTVSDGNLTAQSTVKINVTQSPELFGWRYYDEFGYLFLSGNGWALHEKMGWIFVHDSSSLLNNASWCWSDGLGWFWTGRPYFDYIYVKEFSKWMRWQGSVNEPQGWSLVTDYDSNEVVSGEAFQIKRAASTISSFSNAEEVTNFVLGSEIFSDQDKKQIIEELIFTKSSPTLVNYGIQLSF